MKTMQILSLPLALAITALSSCSTSSHLRLLEDDIYAGGDALPLDSRIDAKEAAQNKADRKAKEQEQDEFSEYLANADVDEQDYYDPYMGRYMYNSAGFRPNSWHARRYMGMGMGMGMGMSPYGMNQYGMSPYGMNPYGMYSPYGVNAGIFDPYSCWNCPYHQIGYNPYGNMYGAIHPAYYGGFGYNNFYGNGWGGGSWYGMNSPYYSGWNDPYAMGYYGYPGYGNQMGYYGGNGWFGGGQGGGVSTGQSSNIHYGPRGTFSSNSASGSRGTRPRGMESQSETTASTGSTSASQVVRSGKPGGTTTPDVPKESIARSDFSKHGSRNDISSQRAESPRPFMERNEMQTGGAASRGDMNNRGINNAGAAPDVRNTGGRNTGGSSTSGAGNTGVRGGATTTPHNSGGTGGRETARPSHQSAPSYSPPPSRGGGSYSPAPSNSGGSSSGGSRSTGGGSTGGGGGRSPR